MATEQYIWLGDDGLVDEVGNLKFDDLPDAEDPWKVWPLLRWQTNDSGEPTLSLAALIQVDEDCPLEQILLWLGEHGKSYPESGDSSEWKVIHFDDTEKKVSEWERIELEVNEGEGDFIAMASLSGTIALANNLKKLPFISFEEGSECKVDERNITLDLKLKITLPGSIFNTDSQPINNAQIDLAFQFSANGKLKINGRHLSGVDDANFFIKLGENTNDNSPWLVAYKEDDKWKATLEIPLEDFKTTYPLLKNFPAEVEFTWKKSAIRLDHDGISIVIPPNDEIDSDENGSDENDQIIAEAVFSLPLIQSGGEDLLSNAVAQLVTSSGGKIPNVLEYKFDLSVGRANDLLEEAVALIRYPIDAEGSFEQPKLVKNALGRMQALFREFQDKGTAELDSFVSRLTDLTGSATEKLAVKLGDAKSLIEDGQGVIDELLKKKRELADYPIPLALTVEHDQENLVFLVVLRVNLWTGRLSEDRAYFYVTKAKKDEGGSGEKEFSGKLDLKILHLTLPPREDWEDVPNQDDHDGYLDFRNQDVVLSATRSNPPQDQPPVTVLFPGGLDKSDPVSGQKKRLRLLLNDFNPDTWPESDESEPGSEPDENRFQLRLGSRGVTLHATADTTRATDIPLGDSAPSGPDLPLRLQEDRQGLKSEIVIINNQIRYATLYGTLGVPGLDNYEADVLLALRQTSVGSTPEVIAEVDLQTSDQSSLARLRTPWLQAQLDDLRMRLEWKDDQWKVDAWASGALSLTPQISSVGGIEGLDAPRAIPFRDLNLTELHKPKNGGVTLASGESPARFELLDGMFRVEFYETTFAYDLEARSASMTVERARFQFEKQGDVDVAVDMGKLSLEFANGRLKMDLDSSLGVSLRIKDAVRFRGEISWHDDSAERYIAAGGNLTLSGFPEVAGMLKIGTGRKQNGKMAPNIAIYGAFDYEADFFAGVTLKRIGVGLGVNNQLRALGTDPEPDEIIRQLDQLNPEIPSAWSFVTRDGLYVSIVATALIGSNRGTERTINAYLAWLMMSIDTNLDIVAAGRFWLFSSTRYIGRSDHGSRPVLVGVMALRPRQKTLTFVAETRPRPAIEANSQLQMILSKARARYSFFLSPQMADSYLEELSFADNFLGVSMQFFASYRLAIGKFGALMRSSQAIRGAYSNSLSTRVGGFSFSGTLGLDVEYGGLISQRGLAAYGMIDARVSFTVSAYIYIPTPAFETRRFEKTISISLTIPYLHCRRWRCRWRTLTITESWTVVVEVPVPVKVMKRYESGQRHLALRMRGAIAFDERGSIGFRGEVSISTRIAGFKLSISPSLRFNHRIVDQVRQRVAAVEHHLNGLRGISPPVGPSAADDGPAEERNTIAAGPRRWFHYTSRRSDGVYHVLVPSPDNPDAWYTPESHRVGQYSNLPLEFDQASPTERRHRSPFHNAVMRMQLTFRNGSDEKAIVDLTMPWDRLNMDALPPDEPESDVTPPTNQQRIELLMRVSEMEAAFLSTAAERELVPDAPDDSAEEQPPCTQCWPQKLADVTIVSDPRVESNARQFWTLQDQRIRPDYAPPAAFRPVTELVSEGFAGAANQGDIGRLLLFDRLNRRAARWSRHENIDPTEQERLTQARGGLVSRILDDLQHEDGPQQFGVIDDIQVERDNLVARRRAPIFVTKRDNGEDKFEFKLTTDILLNSTDLDLQGSEPFPMTIDWGDESEPELSPDIDPRELETDESSWSLTHDYSYERQGSNRFYITITRSDIADASDRCSTDVIVIELLEEKVKRHVGLIFKQDTAWKLESAKIIRFGDGEPTDEQIPGSPVVNFVQEDDVELVPMSFEDPKQAIEAIHDRLECLPACQQYLSGAQAEPEAGLPIRSAPSADARSRIRVSLPVKFHEDLLRNHLPELNRFQIFRQFPWEAAPVLVDDGAFPQMQDIQDQGSWYRLIDNFLYTEDFELNEQRRFVIERLQPETSVIRYWLRAVPYGGIPQGNEPDGEGSARLPMLAWPPVRLFVPPEIPSLPDLSVVMSVKSLKYPNGESSSDEPDEFELRLVDRQGQQIVWGDVAPGQSQPPGLEIWAEQRDLTPSGFYLGDELSGCEGLEQATRGDEILRQRSQLAAEQLPRSTAGRKFLLMTIPAEDAGNENQPYMIPYEKFSPGHAYRLYVRLAIPAEDLLLTPVPMGLMRRLPPEPLQPNTPMRLVETIEFIAAKDWQRIMRPEDATTWLTKAQFDATPLIESPCAAGFPGIRFGWNSLDASTLPAPDGGVEILVQDFDESHRLDRMVVEVQDEMLFQQGHRDFRDPSAWRVHAEIRQRIQKDPPSSTSREFGILAPWSRYYLWQHARNPALDRMVRAYSGLIRDEEKNLRSIAWPRLHSALTYWFAAVFDYQRTPLALRNAEVQRLVDAMVLCAVQLFQGIKLPDTPEVATEFDVAGLLSMLERRETQLGEVLDEIARNDPRDQQIQDREDEYERLKWQLRDFDTADRLAKIILRRRSYAEELFQPEDGGIETAPDLPVNDSEPERLPRAADWDQLIKLYQGWKSPGSDESDEADSASEQDQQRGYDFPLTTKLLELVEADQTENGASTAAAQLKKLVDKFYEKVKAVIGQDGDGDEYRDQMARLVPQAAGLTATLNTLKRDLGERGWTLLLRPHHQLLVAEATDDDADGQQALPVKLADLMPECFRAAAQTEKLADHDFSGSVVSFFNLLERLGFAIDLAITDDLQRLLAQKELLHYLANFQWDEILRSADPGDGAGHEILVCVGREPDTAPNVYAKRAVGYSFLKIAVVPKRLWSLLCNPKSWTLVSQPFELNDGTLTARFTRSRAELELLGFERNERVKAVFGTVEIEFTLNQLRVFDLKISNYSGPVPTEQTGVIDCWPAVKRRLRQWFALRSIETNEAEEQLEAHLQALVALAQYIRKVMVPTPASAVGPKPPPMHYILLEQRFERWVTVPAIGRRSQIVWTAPHRYGQRYQVALRRISRYEPLVHWYLGGQVPTIGRIPKELLGGPTVDLQRCQPLTDDERVTRPVQLQPHPHRIQFIYGLPDAGARSLLSRLSSVRTGYRGIDTSFAYKLIDREELEDVLRHLGTDFVHAKVTLNDSLTVKRSQTDIEPESLNVLVKKGGRNWKAARVRLQNSSDDLQVTFDSERLALSVGAEVTLLHLPEENEESPYFAVWASTNRSDTKIELRQVEGKSLDLSSVENDYLGMFAEFLEGTAHKGMRLIIGYNPADRTITLNQSPPQRATRVRIWRMEPLVHRTPISTSGEPPARLFRHERLVALNELPFFFEYHLRADSLFDVRLSSAQSSDEGPPATAAQDEVIAEAWARRHPAALGVRRASIRKIENSEVDYEFTVFLSRLEDHLTDRELRRLKQDFDANVPKLTLSSDELADASNGVSADEQPNWEQIRPEQLPDLAMAYRILWKASIEETESEAPEGDETSGEVETSGSSGSSGTEPFYVPAVDVVLPHHANWTEKDPETSVLIVSRSPQELKVLKNGSEEEEEEIEKFATQIRVNRWTPSASPVYSVTFRVKIKNPSSVFAFPDDQNRPPKVFLQASRDGALSRLLPLEVLP